MAPASNATRLRVFHVLYMDASVYVVLDCPVWCQSLCRPTPTKRAATGGRVVQRQRQTHLEHLSVYELVSRCTLNQLVQALDTLSGNTSTVTQLVQQSTGLR